MSDDFGRGEVASVGASITAIEDNTAPAANKYRPICGVNAKPSDDDLKKTIDSAAMNTSAIDHFEVR